MHVCRWFIEEVNRLEAETILREKKKTGGDVHPEGAFLVRLGSNSPFALSVK
jgi:hypothetical protein